MKSVERHKLETNVLAHGLELWLERYRPHIVKGVVAIGALIALLFVWSLISGSSAAKHNQDWDAFNSAVVSSAINLEQLRQSAETSPGENWSNMANVTWADGQVMLASNLYIANRAAANEALTKAASAYKGVIDSSKDPEVLNRAHLGLGRVYEMQDDLEKAKQEYSAVTGPYATYAKAQAERVASPETKATYAWLKTAQPPRPVSPMGPGVPGKGPEFSPGDISLPPAEGGAPPAAGTSQGDSFDALMKQIQNEANAAGKDGDRYKAEETGKTPPTPSTEKESPPPPLESKDAADTNKGAGDTAPPPAAPVAPEKKAEK